MEDIWVAVLVEAKIKPEELPGAIVKYMAKSRFWPAPADIVATAREARPPAIFQEQRLPELPGPKMTKEEADEFKREVLDGMKPGPKKIFMALVDGDQEEPRKQKLERIAYQEPTAEEIAETERKKAELRRRAEMEA